jgi:hypothetical protein
MQPTACGRGGYRPFDRQSGRMTCSHGDEPFVRDYKAGAVGWMDDVAVNIGDQPAIRSLFGIRHSWPYEGTS